MKKALIILFSCLLFLCSCRTSPDKVTTSPSDNEAVEIQNQELEAVYKYFTDQNLKDLPNKSDGDSLYEYVIKNKNDLELTADDDWVLFDKFLIRYDKDYTSDLSKSIDNEIQAERFNRELDKSDIEKLLSSAKEEYKDKVSDAPSVSWISYNINDYSGFNAKELVPGKHIVIDVKSRDELGEGAYMSFCYAKESEDSDWSLVNYGY